MLFLYTFIHSKTLSGNFHLSSFIPLPPLLRLCTSEPNLEEHKVQPPLKQIITFIMLYTNLYIYQNAHFNLYIYQSVHFN